MKILFTNFHPRNGGGHVTYIVNLLQGLVGAHQLTVATPSSSRLYRLAKAMPGVEVVDMAFTTRPSSWLADRAILRQLLVTNAFDTVHVNGSADHKQVMLACLGLRHAPRIIFTKHNNHSLTSFGHQLRARFATDHVIAVSDYIKDLLLKSPYKRQAITTIRHGIDIDYFSPVGAVEKLRLREHYLGAGFDKKIILGSAGGTDYEKGWLDLVTAVALLSPEQRTKFHIIVIGDPPNALKLAQVADCGMAGQVSFPGLIDDVRPLLAACDIGYVLSYQEALSFACRELMALGLPVLVTRVGGLPENLTDQREGWIVPPRSPELIKNVLQKILVEPEQLSQMGAYARQRAEREFGLTDFVKATLAIYQ
ncbi:MAG: glycosyltransferase [Zwartia sp.]|jgi:glycosyltransferase involved in cell wall biosynthesis